MSNELKEVRNTPKDEKQGSEKSLSGTEHKEDKFDGLTDFKLQIENQFKAQI